MKKRLLLLFLLPLAICAEQMSTEERDANLKAARVVQYTVTIYRDADNYDKQAWEKALKNVVETVEKGMQEGVDEAEFVGDVVRSMQSMYKRTVETSGMHGLILVGIGDGECPNKCGDTCTCKAEFRGVCPCSAGGETCKGEAVKGCPCVTR